MITTMIIFTNEFIVATTIILTLLSIAIYILEYKIKEIHKRKKQEESQIAKKISIGFYLGACNIFVLILALLGSNYA